MIYEDATPESPRTYSSGASSTFGVIRRWETKTSACHIFRVINNKSYCLETNTLFCSHWHLAPDVVAVVDYLVLINDAQRFLGITF